MDVFWKAAAVWLVIAAIAVANGVFREGVLKRATGERIAHVVSTLILVSAVLIVAFGTRTWMGVNSITIAWLVSAGWLGATLAFEFVAGHYAFGNPWSKILADYDVRRGRVWLLIPATILFAEPLAVMGLSEKWFAPYLISNLIASAMLLAAVARPKIARWTIVLLFLYAGVYNIWLGYNRPLEYQGFAELAVIPWYREFILGPLRYYGGLIIPAIGVGQLMIAGGGALGKRWLALAMLGCCIFLLAIAPLGVGSACPFSFIVSLAAIVVASEGIAER